MAEQIDNRIGNNPFQVEEIDHTFSPSQSIKITKVGVGEKRIMIDFKYYDVNSTISIDEVYGFVDFRFSDWISFKLDGSDKTVMMAKLDNLCQTIIKTLLEYLKTVDTTIYDKVKFLE